MIYQGKGCLVDLVQAWAGGYLEHGSGHGYPLQGIIKLIRIPLITSFVEKMLRNYDLLLPAFAHGHLHNAVPGLCLLFV